MRRQVFSSDGVKRWPDLSCWRIWVLTLALVLGLGLPACSGGGSNGDSRDEELSPPASPTGLESASQDGAIGLGWDASSGADMYRVYRSTSSGVDASGSPLANGIEETEYVDESVDNGTTYYYVVTAVVSEGGQTAESDPSNEVEKTPFSDPPDRP